MASSRKTQNLPLYLFSFFILCLLIPAVTKANGSSEAYLDLQPIQAEVQPGDMVEINVILTDANALYGLQVTCSADPAVLAWQSTQFGDVFTEPLIGARNIDVTAGTWTGAISQKNPAPPLFGSGSFATLIFEAVAPGTTAVSCEPLASDRDWLQLPTSTTVSPPIVVLDQAEISSGIVGRVIYQGRTNHAGIEVAVVQAGVVLETSDTGQFELGNLNEGTYLVQADAALHLPSCARAVINANEMIELESTTLVGGDIDDSNEIRINDVTLVGSNFGLRMPTTQRMDTRADINADGEVNVQDLSILGGNFGKSGCQEWLLVLEF